MKPSQKRDLDVLGSQLLKARSEEISELEITTSPFFMARVRARISAAHEEKTGLDFEGAWNWLIALGLVAVTLFIGGAVSYRGLTSSQPASASAYVVAGSESAALEKGLEDPLIIAESK